MRKVYLSVEGQGDEAALPNLLSRLASSMALEVPAFPIAHRLARCTEADVGRQCEDLRRLANADGERFAGAMFLRDDEDGCPKRDAPLIAEWVRRQKLPFPVAVVLFYREYETMFVATLGALAVKQLRDKSMRELVALDETAKEPADPEAYRDAKGYVSRFLPKKHPYRETTHQYAMTVALNVDVLRASGLPCVGSLERGLRFVLTESSGVYPPASAST